MKAKIGILGATGYTGSELARILHLHPDVDICGISSQSHKGKRFSDIHPQFSGIVDTALIKADDLLAQSLDMVFLALPHGVSMKYVAHCMEIGLPTIDLSADFRLSSPKVYEDWYPGEHTFKPGFEKACYGLPEIYGERVPKSKLIANPGCYPTSSILAMAPLLSSGQIDPKDILVDAKSGVTGAGVKAKPSTHFSTVNDNFKAYGLKSHRHTIEIQEQSSHLMKEDTQIQFTPHLLPIDRGILSTVYLKPNQAIHRKQLVDCFASFYSKAPFVRVRDQPPSIKDVRGSNYCDLFVDYDERTHRIIVISVIDNLIKGAAGQAVQNMNLLFGFSENKGLETLPLVP